LSLIEAVILRRNWTRWARNECNHQFDHNIGIGNVKGEYEGGNYGFDPLNLHGKTAAERLNMTNKELNNGRLAMVGFIGMLGQEYLTGESAVGALLKWTGAALQTSNDLQTPL
jgi:hypothetical protein